MRMQCDQLRKVIEQIRKHESEILAFCVDKARILHAQFLKGNCSAQEAEEAAPTSSIAKTVATC